jgi:hypothetical protein
VLPPPVPVTLTVNGLVVLALSPLTVTVVLCPAVIDEGLKEQVAPEEQENVIFEVKLLAPTAVTVKVVEVVPIRILLVRLLAESVKRLVPVPLRETAWEPPEALSEMVRAPVRDPLAVGVKLTLTAQLVPGLSVAPGMPVAIPQVLVSAKSPEAVIAVRVMAELLPFTSRTFCAGLVEPTGSPGKIKLLGVTVRTPPPADTPLPVTVIMCGLPAALSVIATCSVLGPITVGLYVILIVQVALPAGTVAPQLLISAKSPLAWML